MHGARRAGTTCCWTRGRGTAAGLSPRGRSRVTTAAGECWGAVGGGFAGAGGLRPLRVSAGAGVRGASRGATTNASECGRRVGGRPPLRVSAGWRGARGSYHPSCEYGQGSPGAGGGRARRCVSPVSARGHVGGTGGGARPRGALSGGSRSGRETGVDSRPLDSVRGAMPELLGSAGSPPAPALLAASSVSRLPGEHKLEGIPAGVDPPGPAPPFPGSSSARL